MPAISGSRTRSIIGRAWQPSTTRLAAAVMPRCAGAATATAAPCALSPTACSRWPAPRSNSRLCRPHLQGSAGRRRASLRLPSLCSIEIDHPFVPTCLLADAARSGSQGCRRDRGAPAQRRKRPWTERARCYPCLEALHHDGVPWGYRPAFLAPSLVGRSFSTNEFVSRGNPPHRSRTPGFRAGVPTTGDQPRELHPALPSTAARTP